MPEPLATPSDVADIWRPLTDTETAQATNLIAKASSRLRQKCPFDIDTRIALYSADSSDPQALDPLLVADVVANIVKRVMTNPAGVLSQSNTTGPLSASVTFASRTSDDGATGSTLVVTDADIDQLRPAVPSMAVPSSFRYKMPVPQILIPGDRFNGRPEIAPDCYPERGAK